MTQYEPVPVYKRPSVSEKTRRTLFNGIGSSEREEMDLNPTNITAEEFVIEQQFDNFYTDIVVYNHSREHCLVVFMSVNGQPAFTMLGDDIALSIERGQKKRLAKFHNKRMHTIRRPKKIDLWLLARTDSKPPKYVSVLTAARLRFVSSKHVLKRLKPKCTKSATHDDSYLEADSMETIAYDAYEAASTSEIGNPDKLDRIGITALETSPERVPCVLVYRMGPETMDVMMRRAIICRGASLKDFLLLANEKAPRSFTHCSLTGFNFQGNNGNFHTHRILPFDDTDRLQTNKLWKLHSIYPQSAIVLHIEEEASMH